MPVQSKSLRAQITWNTKRVQKSSEKVHKYTKKAWLEHRLEKTLKKVVRVLKISEICVRNGRQKSEGISGYLPLGASCGSFGAPIDCLMQKVQPKSSQNADETAKVTPKDTPRTYKCVKNDAEF